MADELGNARFARDDNRETASHSLRGRQCKRVSKRRSCISVGGCIIELDILSWSEKVNSIIQFSFSDHASEWRWILIAHEEQFHGEIAHQWQSIEEHSESFVMPIVAHQKKGEAIRRNA